ncbi:MAG: metallophosphoesterase family protein [Alphaproteobacteria bacterium]
MLPRLRVLQVGDVHYPSASTANRSIDDKDAKFPLSLKGSVSSLPLKAVIKRIHSELSGGNVDALLFMGDLTDHGNLEGFETCAAYLMDALELRAGKQFEKIPTGFVPGNHDIDRTLAISKGIAGKFETLAAAMTGAGATRFPTNTAVSIDISAGSARASIHLLNSCWGCGEPENIPAEFRDAIKAAIDKVITDDPKAAATYYDRQLDTPAFDSDTIAAVAVAVAEGSATSLPILVAHHNLLPQRMPRLAPYTELVNSGALRAALIESGRPSLYLHGHIHEDPVEVVNVSQAPPLVIISAPEASAGFNFIEIVFMQSGLPLACEVIPYRFEAGVIKRLTSISVPLIGSRRRSSDRRLAKLYAKILDQGESYWSEVMGYAKVIDPDFAEEDVIEILELLNADGSALIENRDLAPRNWIVRATV